MVKHLLQFSAVMTLFVGCQDSRPLEVDPSEVPPRQVDTPSLVAQQVLADAITALGGDAARDQLRKGRIRFESQLPKYRSQLGAETLVTEDVFEAPDKLRRVVTVKESGEHVMTSVVNGETIWTKNPGRDLIEQPAPTPDVARPAIISTLERLSNLLQSGVQMSAAVARFDGVDTICLTVSGTDGPKEATFFDLKTHLVLGSIKSILVPPGVPVEERRLQETVTYSRAYKRFGDAMLPTEFVAMQEGEVLLTTRLLEFDPLTGVDPALFDPPDDPQ